MPHDYLDTERLNPEGDNELGYTIGTSRGRDLVAGKFYEIFIRTKLGNANTDRGKVIGARTHRFLDSATADGAGSKTKLSDSLTRGTSPCPALSSGATRS